jgi:hypothetical protein
MKITEGLTGAAMAVCLGVLGTSARADTVTIPDTNPGSYTLFGSGDATVTYDGVTFATSAGIGDGQFYNIGSNYYLGNPAAVLSDQGAVSGVENILITLPTAAHTFSLNYGTFNGSDVTFYLSNGDSFVQGSTGAFYSVIDSFTVSSAYSFNSVFVTSPDNVLNINNISYAAGVPEPAAWALLFVGFATLGATMRNRRRKPTVATV